MSDQSDNLPALQSYTVSDIEVMSKQVAASKLFGLDAPQAFALMLLAQAKGLHPIQAVERYHVIHNRPSMKSDAVLAEFQARGGTVRWTKRTNLECEGIFYHPIHAPDGETSRFTMEDAKRGDLLKNDLWRKFPANMLRARVVTNAIKLILPGIVAGFDDIEARPNRTRVRATAAIDVTPQAQPALKPPDEPVAPVAVESVLSYEEAAAAFVDGRNTDWLDWLDESGTPPPDGIKPLLHRNQLTNHLLKWGLLNGRIEPFVDFDPETGKPLEIVEPGERTARVAAMYAADPEAVAEECELYARELAEAARRKWDEEHGGGERKGDVFMEAEEVAP